MNTDDTRHEWVCAVLEGRLATADYLAPDLPAASRKGYVRVPDDCRDNHAAHGEIGGE